MARALMSVSGESNTGNNCSSGVSVTVGASAGSPDLIVESPSVNDSTLTTGQSFTLRATVHNQGQCFVSRPRPCGTIARPDATVSTVTTRKWARTAVSSPVGGGHERRVDQADCAVECRHVFLRRLCGCGFR